MEDHCHVEAIQKVVAAAEQEHVETVRLAVWGMGCSNCASRVRNSLLSLNGVVYADVDHANGTARVAFNPELASIDALIRAVGHAGNDGRHEYGATLLQGA